MSNIFRKKPVWIDSDGQEHVIDGGYDLVIRTQAEFEDMITDGRTLTSANIQTSTWKGAKSVAFVGEFVLNFVGNGGIKRPSNVTRIDGFNNAKITVTNFVFDSSKQNGGLYNESAGSVRCHISNLTVDCKGTGTGPSSSSGYGFSGDNNTYTNCTGTGTGYSGYGFSGDNNTYTNCTGTGPGSLSGYGFYGNNNTYTNCTGTGFGFGFSGTNNTYTNCTGTGASSTGYGFRGNDNNYTNCTGTGTGTGNNGYGFRGDGNTYTNCTGTGASSTGYGFYGNYNIYTNCTGTGTGSTAYGFSGDNNTYTNCTGEGTGEYASYGFQGDNNRIISCTALAHISMTSGMSCVPISNPSTNVGLFMIIKNCKFPQIAKSGYKQGTVWCDIAINTTMVGKIQDNIYHSRFKTAVLGGTGVVKENNQAVNIITL